MMFKPLIITTSTTPLTVGLACFLAGPWHASRYLDSLRIHTPYLTLCLATWVPLLRVLLGKNHIEALTHNRGHNSRQKRKHGLWL
ncbi:hypothetical protein DER45DRAFT_549602 [Fusarium avenaceum]|nr:hypothetical protein DER45DRAFT_549602 [Fusarium avenaceum]